MITLNEKNRIQLPNSNFKMSVQSIISYIVGFTVIIMFNYYFFPMKIILYFLTGLSIIGFIFFLIMIVFHYSIAITFSDETIRFHYRFGKVIKVPWNAVITVHKPFMSGYCVEISYTDFVIISPHLSISNRKIIPVSPMIGRIVILMKDKKIAIRDIEPIFSGNIPMPEIGMPIPETGQSTVGVGGQGNLKYKFVSLLALVLLFFALFLVAINLIYGENQTMLTVEFIIIVIIVPILLIYKFNLKKKLELLENDQEQDETDR